MRNHQKFVVFTLDTQRYAMPYVAVERVIRAIEITPLPKAPTDMLGIINIQGEIIPVLNIRKQFGLSEQELALHHFIIICHIRFRSIAFVVDDTQGLIDCSPTELVAGTEIHPGIQYINKIAKQHDELILIIDPEELLTPAEEQELQLRAQNL